MPGHHHDQHAFRPRHLAVLLACVVALAGLQLIVEPVTAVTSTPAAASTSTTVEVAADTYIDQNLPTTNYGTANPIKATSSVRRALFRFATSAAVPAGNVATGATLRIYATRQDQPSGAFEAHPLADGWTETGVTWNTAPPWNPTVLGTSTQSGANLYYEMALPASAINPSGNSNFGVRGTVANMEGELTSDDASASKAQLVISYRPTSTTTTVGSTTTTTTAAPGGDPTIAAAGDIACDSSTPGATTCHQAATADLLAAGNFTAVLGLGDHQYPSGALDDFNAYYDPTWGQVKAKTYPAPGNHEYMTGGAAGYFAYFGDRAGPAGRGYYSFDVGSWHIVSLNSEISMAAGSAQLTWLQGDLAASSQRCTLAYWHKPLFSSGPHGDDASVKPLWDALYAADAEVVLAGHDHAYERFAPQTPSGSADATRGIREFVVGTGGKEHYSISSTRPNSQVHNSDTFGVLRLTLHPDGYDWKFLPEAGKTFTDSGTDSCH